MKRLIPLLSLCAGTLCVANGCGDGAGSGASATSPRGDTSSNGLPSADNSSEEQATDNPNGGSAAAVGGTDRQPGTTGEPIENPSAPTNPEPVSTDRPELQDVRFWARTDEGVTYDGDGNVTGWSSLEGTFGEATFSETPPTFETAEELGNKPVIRFEAALEQWAGWRGLAIGTQGDFSITYVARVRHDPTQVNNEWYIVGNNGTTSETRGAGAFYGNWDAAQPNSAYDGFDLQPNGGTVDYSVRVDDEWRVHTYTREAATADVRYWVDGFEHTGDWASTNWRNPEEDDAIVMVGAQIFSLEDQIVQQLGNVVIAELILTASNNADNVRALHRAMMAEYGIAGVAP